MTRINYTHTAGPDTHFAPHAFDNMIGKEVPVRVGDEDLGTGRVASVTVSADGGSAKLGIELPEGTEALWNQARRNSELSIGLASTP